METIVNDMKIFKDYILNTSPYKGGSSGKETGVSGALNLHKMSSLTKTLWGFHQKPWRRFAKPCIR